MPGFDISEYYDLGEISKVEFIRQNENKVYRVDSGRGSFVLRVHEKVQSVNTVIIKGTLDSDTLTESELTLLETIADSGKVLVQRPVRNQEGGLVSRIGGQAVTVLKWIEGESFADIELTGELMFRLGQVIAELHRSPAGCDLSGRPDYGEPLINRLRGALDTALAEGHINAGQRETMCGVLAKMSKVLAGADTGYVHADLGRSNFILTDSGEIAVIDHSMSGRCAREFDIASLLMHFEQAGQEMAGKLVEGYRSVGGDVDMGLVQLCEAYQIVMFIASQHEVIFSQPWFGEALDFWCSGIMKRSIHHQKYEGEIGLYSM